MKTAVVLVAGTFAFLASMQAEAGADVAEPYAPVQPIASTLIEGTGQGAPPAQQQADPAAPTSGTDDGAAADAEDPAAVEPTAATADELAPATPPGRRMPAPEAVVRPVPARDRADDRGGGWAVFPQTDPVRSALERVGNGATSFLAHVGEACRIGVAKGPGGPVLLLAVLATALLLERRWVLFGRAGVDDDRQSYLSALEVIDPG